ncbi:MAG: retroviral-like aspartic protease family protein [Gemmataceae bacterium]
MPTFRYRYAAITPPAPALLLNLTHPITGTEAQNISVLLDTGADQTVLPERLAEQLELLKLDQELIRGFDGAPQVLGVYSVVLQVRDLIPFEIKVIASPKVASVVVGRDVLNRYRLVLDGPNGVLEITGD